MQGSNGTHGDMGEEGDMGSGGDSGDKVRTILGYIIAV